MPLVIFNYDQAVDVVGAPVLDHFTQELEIPRWGHDRKWKLLAVNAAYMSNEKEDFRHLEVSFPELMTTKNVVYANTSVDNTETPENAFRFYVNTYPSHYDADNRPSNAVTALEDSVQKTVSVYPNYDLGTHRLENTKISCVVSAKAGNVLGGAVSLRSYSIILGYEE